MRNSKGEGSFHLNSDGSFTFRKGVGFKIDGRRKTLTVTAASKTACIREMKKKEMEWNESRNNSSYVNYTLKELCLAHLSYQIDRSDLKPKSIDRREVTIEKHIGDYPIAEKHINEIGTADIDDFINSLINERRLSASSIQKVLDVINASYKFGEMRSIIHCNPVLPIKLSLKKRINKLQAKECDEADVRVLSEEEEKIFLQEIMKKESYPYGMYLALLLYTGMRIGEMLALTWADIDSSYTYINISKAASVVKNRFNQGDKKYIIHVGTTKNEKARRIKLCYEAQEIIAKLVYQRRDKSKDSLLVTTSTGRANTATNMEHRMNTICKRAGLSNISGLHILRRTFATRMYERGARIKEIAAYIGDLPSTTERYYIGIRRKVSIDEEIVNVVPLPIGDESKYDEVKKNTISRGRVRKYE